MAKFHLTKGDTLTAINWYKKGIDTNSSFETCLEELRDLYIEQKECDEAILLLNQVIADTALSQGLVIYPGSGSVDGRAGDHLMVGPPFCINKDEITQLVEILEGVVATSISNYL